MREASNTPTALTLEKSEYEKIREGNIAEREAMVSALKAGFAEFKKDSGIAVSRKAPPKKKKRIEYDSRSDEAGFQRKSARLSGTPADKELEVIYIKTNNYLIWFWHGQSNIDPNRNISYFE